MKTIHSTNPIIVSSIAFVPARSALPACAALLALSALTTMPNPCRAEDAKATSIVVGKAVVDGKVTGISTTFAPADHKIYCEMRVSKPELGVKYTAQWFAVDAAGMKNYKIIEVSAPRLPGNSYSSTLKMPRDFPVGKYRVDWLRNGKAFSTLAFAVK